LIVGASLIIGDAAAAFAALSLSGVVIGAIGLGAGQDHFFLIALLILCFFCVGLYSACGPSPYERFRLRTFGVATAVAMNLLIRVPIELGPSLALRLYGAIPLLLIGHYIEAMIRALLIHFKLWGAPTVLVGSGDQSRKLAHVLLDQPALGLMPIGFVSTAGDDPSMSEPLPLPLIGGPASRGLMQSPAEYAIFLSAAELCALASDPESSISRCRPLLVEGMSDIRSLWLHTRTLGAAIGIEIKRDFQLWYNQLLKRTIDIVFAILAGLLVWPIVAVLALAIKLVDRGPAFYVHKRVGRDGAPLRVFKLRTMYTDAERCLEEHLSRDPTARAEWNRFYKLSRDPRVLPIVGNFMRRTSLDELPQLWNVIRGDMSLVGPRPFPEYHVGSFDREFRALRTSVKPGITGIWQVSSRSNGDVHVQRAQDLFYIRNWSIWLDIFILLETLPALLCARGAR
jgi:Undecaprenyl-phosphate galactose phosphotransferase WbaP